MFDELKNLESLPGVNPVDVSHLKMQVLMRMMDYVYPKRKPIESPAPDAVTVDPVIERVASMKPEERQARLLELKKGAG